MAPQQHEAAYDKIVELCKKVSRSLSCRDDDVGFPPQQPMFRAPDPATTRSCSTVCTDYADDLPAARYAVRDPCWVVITSPSLLPGCLCCRDVVTSCSLLPGLFCCRDVTASSP
ncbi:hypothetical protein U9M48_014383 [Paspalum notatum var. saurae]|uniref:Uncharacterized protein n=1 Tax=Paspalum notatum var. saurae TaxID=547442 RepID=A0AAQ3WKQ5_PASNO